MSAQRKRAEALRKRQIQTFKSATKRANAEKRRIEQETLKRNAGGSQFVRAKGRPQPQPVSRLQERSLIRRIRNPAVSSFLTARVRPTTTNQTKTISTPVPTGTQARKKASSGIKFNPKVFKLNEQGRLIRIKKSTADKPLFVSSFQFGSQEGSINITKDVNNRLKVTRIQETGRISQPSRFGLGEEFIDTQATITRELGKRPLISIPEIADSIPFGSPFGSDINTINTNQELFSITNRLRGLEEAKDIETQNLLNLGLAGQELSDALASLDRKFEEEKARVSGQLVGLGEATIDASEAANAAKLEAQGKGFIDKLGGPLTALAIAGVGLTALLIATRGKK